MIAQIGSGLKVEKSSHHLTSFAGLPLLTELAHRTGIVERLESLPGLWKRKREMSSADYILGLALTLIAGGEGLDDIRMLRADAGLRQLSLPGLPAANSLGRFLKRFTHRSLHRLGEIVTSAALLSADLSKTLTLDLDASLIESDKKDAKKTYKGFDGYNPVLAWLAEADVFLGGVFREGNASPQCNLVSLLKYCHRRLPSGSRFRLRSDSAGYRLDLIEYCHRRGIEFAIGADLDCAVREAIDKIPEKHWRLVVRGEDTFLLAETIHVPGAHHVAKQLPAFRLIVTRRLRTQLELFKDPIVYRAILTSLPASLDTVEALDFYNGRGAMEKAIGELKNGYGAHWLPCGQLAANAAFFQTTLLAYNLLQAFKRVALPPGWSKFCVKNLRFRLLCQAAVVVRHARYLAVKLSKDFPFFDLFEQARWSILSPPLAKAAI
ncbi:MAG: IS1380 family transposase [Elusimicrobiota bacterium]